VPSFSKSSRERLATCDERLQRIAFAMIEWFDFTVICGHRDQKTQDQVFRDGFSKVKWPDGEHNEMPSRAIDAVPYPIDWKDIERMALFAGAFIATGRLMGITIRWGGDWDRDTKVQDNEFDDRVHFEIVGT
jgi:peptidoglycan L-alanyl-D-glutamate endopeptidase CwlK